MNFNKLYDYVFLSDLISERATDFYSICEKYKNENNVFFTFTEVQKVGLNPTSTYNTPLGIYCYPMKQAWEQYISLNKKLPFGQQGGMFVTFFSLKSPEKIIQDISKITEQQFLNYFKKLSNIYEKQMHEPLTINNIKNQYKATYELEDLVTTFEWYKSDKTLGHKLWAYTRDVANILGGVGTNLQDEDEWEVISNNTIKWNIIFKNIDIYGVVDRSGSGIIHENEPIQAVIFDSSLIHILEQIKYETPESIKKEKQSFKVSQQVVDEIMSANSLIDLDLYNINYKSLPEQAKNKIKDIIKNENNMVALHNIILNKNTFFYKSLPNDVIFLIKNKNKQLWSNK